MGNPILYIVIPCYNEEAVLPLTSGMFLKKIKDLAAAGKISDKSRILFVNDGSKDKTWDIIRSLAEADEHYRGVCLSRNRGHQNALLAGLMTAKDLADVTISIDCDGQDDINAMDAMIDEYLAGMDVVYGVRSKRETDTWFKRTTAEGFYKVMKALGADVVFNHADYRLLSKRALEGLAEFREVNLFLRGLVPLVGYRCSSVYYERAERIAGESHYPLKKMLAFAFDGITSLSVKPLRLITLAGMLVSAVSFVAIIVTLITKLVGFTVTGWTSMICAIYFLGGVQLLAVLLCLHQAMYLNHLLAVDYQRSEQEAAVVRTLGTELVRDYGTDKPVVLVGRYTLGENITRYTTADPMQHPLYRFFREHTSWESGDTVKYVETNCNSVLNWSVTAFSEVDDVYGQAAEHLFRYYGFALDMTHSAALHEQAQTYADAHDLPGYPRAGAIVDCGDYVLVNLQ